MSTSIEQRVVQMRFDNKQFESGIAQSMDSLDKFNKSLKFDESSKAFDSISKAAGQVSLAPIIDQTDKVGAKFDAMAVVAISAIQRMTNSAITAGTNMAKSLSVDQIMAGWNKYEQKTGSVQTIMNATGKSIDEVNGYLDKLMWFSDETSYGFNDMTAAIGQLTSAGGNIDRLVPMVMGIANATAFAGKGVNEFSRSIYNLNQSYSAGYLQYMDWKSLELAGVASKQLKQVFIETAEELGKINKGTVTLANFGTTLKDKWADTEVMEEAFGKFGEMTEKAYEMVQSGMVETASEAYEILSETYDGYSIVAARAAQEAKSFAEAVDATKDAVSSGWMKTFEIVFGNYEEAKVLWTDLANTMWDIFASGAEDRNAMLQVWKDLGGRTDMIEAVTSAFHNLWAVLEVVRNAYLDIFPPITGERLAATTKAVKEFIKSLEFSEAALNTLRVAVKAILLPLQIIVQTLRVGIVVAALAVKSIFDLVDAVMALPSLIGSANDPLRKIFGDERYERIAQALLKIVNKLGDGFEILGNKVKSVLSSFRSSIKLNLPESFNDLIDSMKPIADWVLDRIVDGFEALSKLDYSKIGKVAETAIDMMSQGLINLINILKNAKDWTVEFFSQFKSPVEMLKAIAKAIYNVGLNVVDFFRNLNLQPYINSLVDRFGAFGEILGRVAQAVVDFISKLTPAKILVFSFGVSLVAMILTITSAISKFKKIAEGATSILSGVSGLLSALTERVKGNRFLQIAIAIGALAGALIILSQVNPEGLKSATVSLLEIMAAFTGMIALLAIIEKFLLKTPEMIKGLKEIGIAMLAMSASIGILSASLWALSKIDMDGIVSKLIAIGVMIAGIAVAMKLMKGSSKLDVADSLYMLSFALSINLLIKALSNIGDANLNGAISNLGSMVVIIGLLAVLARTTRNVKFTSGTGILLTVASLLVLAKALEAVSKINTAKLVKGLVNFIPVFTTLALIKALSLINGESMTKTGVGLLSMAAGILIMYEAIKLLGQLDIDVLVKGTATVSALMLVFGAMMAISKLGSERKMAKLEGSFIAMGAAILILGLAIDYIGGLELSKVIKGTAVVSALLVLLTYLASAIGSSNKATATVISMTACIGLLVAAVALLTLLDPYELAYSVAAISASMLSLGTMIKLIGDLKLKSAATSLLILSGVMIELGIAFAILSKADPNQMINVAGSLSIAMVSIGVMMKLLQSYSGDSLNIKDIGSTLLLLAGILVEVGSALVILDKFVVGDGLLEKVISMSVLIGALTAVALVLSKVEINVSDAAKGAAGVAAVGAIIAAFITIFGAVMALGAEDFIRNGVEVLNSLYTVIPALAVLTALTLAMKLIGQGGGATIEYAAIGALALDAVAALLVTLLTTIGAIFNANPKWKEYLEDSIEVFNTLGRVFGALVSGFVGEAVGGTLEAISAKLPQIATNFSDFGTNIQGFLTAIDGVDAGKVGAITSLADMMLKLTAADFLNQIIPFVDDDPLGKFAKKLVEIAPDIVDFSNLINDINGDKIIAVADVMGSFADVMSNIPTEGGLMGAIFGNKNMESFGNGMKSFAEGFKTYAEVIDTANLSKDTVDKTKYATEALIELANNVPESGGLLQTFLGEHDIGNFGTQLATFAKGLVRFFRIISGQDSGIGDVDIDYEMVDKCASASKALAEFASEVPSSGGSLQKFFGEQNIGTFGDQLYSFGRGLVRFFRIINGDDSEAGAVDINKDIVDSSIYAGEAFAGLAKQLKPVGGYWQKFVGEVDLGLFGDQIGLFGKGMYDFFTLFQSANITDDDVNNAKNAAEAFTELVNNLKPNEGFGTIFESVNLEEFGKDLAKFGDGMAGYYTNIKEINFDVVERASAFIRDLIRLSGELETLSTIGASNLNVVLAELANNSITAFAEAFKGGYQLLKEAIDETIIMALDGVRSSATSTSLDFSFIIVSAVNSITANEYLLVDKATSLADLFQKTMKAQGEKYEAVASWILFKLTIGLGNTADLEQKVIKVAQKIVDTANTTLGITTGSSSKFEEIGKYCIVGFTKGIEVKLPDAKKSIQTAGTTLINTFSSSVGVNSPSVIFKRIAEYTMLGFKNGIEGSSSLTKKTMVKMGGLIISSLQNALGIHSPSTVARDEVGRYIVRGVAEGITKDMSAEEAAAKKAQNIVDAFKTVFDKLSLSLSTSNLEYDLWKALNPNAAIEVAASKQMDILNTRIKNQAERVNAANAQYQANLKLFGEASEDTISAYNTYLQEQINLVELVNSSIEDAFSTVFDKLSINLNTSNLEYELWQKLNPDSSEAESKERDILDTRLKNQAERVNAANAQYQANLERFGKDADVTISAYSTYLQEQINFADLANQLMDAQKKSLEDSYNFLYEMGYTYKEIKDWEKAEPEIFNTFTPPKDVDMSSIQSIMDSYLNFAASSSNIIDSMVQGIADSNVEVVIEESIAKSVSNGVKNGTASSSRSSNQAGAAVVESMAQGITGNSDTISKAVNQAIDKAKETVGGNSWGVGINAVEGFIDGAKSKASNAADSVIDVIGNDPLNAVKSKLGINSPSIEYMAVGGYVVQGFANGISDNASLPINAVTMMAKDSLEEMSNQPDKYYSIGSQICSGLANGITANAYLVRNATSLLANQALNSTRNVLDVHSPSREYYKIGEMMDQGLANGIIDSASIVTNAVSGMLGKAQKTANRNGLVLSSVVNIGHNMRPEDNIRLLQWDPTGELIPTGYKYGGNNPDAASWWIAPSTEVAEAIRYMGDTVQEELAKKEANSGLYTGTLSELRDALQAFNNNGGTGSGVSYVQNNYSPVSLSASKIYNNTQTLLARRSAGTSPTNQSLKTLGTGQSSSHADKESIRKNRLLESKFKILL